MKRTVRLGASTEGLDLTRYEVITPHRGAARALGVPYKSLSSLALGVIKSKGYQVASPLTARRALTSTVRDVLGVADTSSMASRLELPLQTVLRTGMDAKALEEFGSERVRQLAWVAAEYQFRLRRRGLMDQSEVLWQASVMGARPRRVYVHGYYRSRPEEVAFVNKLAGDGSLMALPLTDHAMFAVNREAIDLLGRHGWGVETPHAGDDSVGAQLCRRFTGDHDPAAPEGVRASVHPDIESELRGALGAVKRLLAAGTPSNDIIIVSRDARLYGPAALAVAAEYGVPVRTRYDVPLPETRFGAWLAMMLDAVLGGFQFETTLRLLVHPVGPELPAVRWHAARAKRPAGLDAWREHAPELDALDWPGEDSRGSWVGRLAASLNALKVRSKVGRWARETVAYHTLFEELQLAREGAGETLSRERFRDEVLEVMALLTVPYQTGSGGVEIHEPHTLLGSKYRHVFVLGMSEGVTPGPVAENPVIDFHERKKLLRHGVEFEDAAAVTRWEALSFYFMLDVATESVTFSRPAVIDNKERIASPYLTQLGLKADAAPASSSLAASPAESRRVLLLRADEPSGDPVLAAARHSLHVERLRERPGPYDEYDGATGIALDHAAHWWSASQLTRIGQCPFKWFAERALGARPPDEPAVSLTALIIGRLYHKTLELALAPAPNVDDGRRVALGRLESAFEAAEADEEVLLPRLPAWAAQRLEHIETLRRAILSPEFLRPGARVIDLERKFEGEWRGLKVRGVIDRVDETPDGLVMVDYKLGGTAPAGVKDEAGKAKLDVQLPIYMEAAAPRLYPERAVAGGYYYSLGKAKLLREAAPDDGPRLEEFAGRVRAHLAEGYFPVEPDADQSACRYCDHETVCRKGYRLDRKRGR